MRGTSWNAPRSWRASSRWTAETFTRTVGRATERKHLPVQDVMYVGDWLDVRSLQACYQLVDAETLYAVVTEPRKLRKKALANLNNTVHNTVHERS